MIFTRGANVLKVVLHQRNGVPSLNNNSFRKATTSASGSILPEPRKPRFGYLGVIFAVGIGLFIGATISKNIANFLEENELFVPSDDDDDD